MKDKNYLKFSFLKESFGKRNGIKSSSSPGVIPMRSHFGHADHLHSNKTPKGTQFIAL